MGINPRTAFFLDINANTVAELQLDPNIYDSTAAGKLGLTKTAPPDTKDVIRMSIKKILKTGKAVKLLAQCSLGTGENRKTRAVPLICEIGKLTTAVTQLKSETVKLGNGGVGVTWTVDRVTIAS